MICTCNAFLIAGMDFQNGTSLNRGAPGGCLKTEVKEIAPFTFDRKSCKTFNNREKDACIKVKTNVVWSSLRQIETIFTPKDSEFNIY